MAKKEKISSLVSGIIGTENSNGNVMPQNNSYSESNNRELKNSKQVQGSEYMVTSIRVDRRIMKKLKIIAATEERPLHIIINAAFKLYISTWEEDNR